MTNSETAPGVKVRTIEIDRSGATLIQNHILIDLVRSIQALDMRKKCLARLGFL